MSNFLHRVEWTLRHAVVYPFLRLLIRNEVRPQKIDLQSVSSILILRYDKIGDMIVTLPILRGLKIANPKMRIGILASTVNAELIANDTSVDECHILGPDLSDVFKTLWTLRSRHFEVVLNFVFNRTTSGALIANLVGPRGLKVGQGDQKYHFYFNKVVSLGRNATSMTAVLQSFIDQTFSSTPPLRIGDHSIAVPVSTQSSVDQFLQRHDIRKRNFVAVNLSVGEPIRRMTEGQYRAIVRHVWEEHRFKIVLLALPADHVFAHKLVGESNQCTLFPDSMKTTLLEIAAVVARARAVVSPDTSIVHFAAAMETPVVAIYASEKVDEEWMPSRVSAESVCSEAGKPVSAIQSELITGAIDRLFRARKKR